MLELMNAHQLAVFGKADVTAEELRTWLTTPSVDVQHDVRVLEQDGRLVGYVDADKTRNEPVRWWSDLKVAPDVDAAQVVPELLAWLEQRADDGLLRVWTSADDERLLPLTERRDSASHGTRTGWRSTSTARDASRHGPPAFTCARSSPTTSVGSTRSSSRSGRTRRNRSPSRSRSFATGPRSARASTRACGSSSSTAIELAAFALDNPDDVDPDTGYVNLLGVRRPWRKQGLGEALLLHSFGVFRERGYTRATLGVDASSPTGATRLYERAGMRVYRDTVMLDRPVRRS